MAGLKRSGLDASRADYRVDANPSFLTYGPANRREFLALRRADGGMPG